MKSSITTSTLAVLAGISLLSQATAQVTIDWVRVENLNNAADTSGYGAVSYGYSIGKYEVTNAQYTVFLNAKASTDTYGLYNENMASIGITRSGSSGSYTYSVTQALANRPVAYVSWYDAARFTNWLHNGQGSGSTETGAYTLNGNTGTPTRNAGAIVWLPSENEWYKAAYYDPTKGGSGGYWTYPNKSDSVTTADANFSSSQTKDVGYYSSDPSFYGTFDQGGNVWEWNDAVVNSNRLLRGGSWYDTSGSMASSIRNPISPTTEGGYANVGFRVASVPEPSGLVLTMLIGAGFVCHRRR